MRPSYQQGIGRYLQRPRAMLRYDGGLVAAPADRAKRRFLLRLFKERNHELLVESGTFLGGTVDYFLPHARRIVSVEIEPRLYEAAQHHFKSSPSVELVLGDALEEIPRVLAGVSEPPLVYLDGHFTGGVNKEPGRFVEPAPGILEQLGTLGLPPAPPSSWTTSVCSGSATASPAWTSSPSRPETRFLEPRSMSASIAS